ncbi:Hypothetical predicted protein [Olea europaea subsp. europaea]|uniref:Uncharacterized protein n=1 Tax=Olea europaea subsp. europaea TaxID=158383 RepID=A0A8S0SB31_OLEEU|nr:Hypothetical predicted protein [Olea europaea subsp. europaea]
MTPNPTSKSASLTPGGGAYRLLEMPAFEPTLFRLTESLTHIRNTWIKTASVRSTPGFSKFVPSHPCRGSKELVEVSTQPPATASST